MVAADWRRGHGITIEYSGFGGDAWGGWSPLHRAIIHLRYDPAWAAGPRAIRPC